MNINNISFRTIGEYFGEKILPILTPRGKIIVTIALLALGCLTAVLYKICTLPYKIIPVTKKSEKTNQLEENNKKGSFSTSDPYNHWCSEPEKSIEAATKKVEETAKKEQESVKKDENLLEGLDENSETIENLKFKNLTILPPELANYKKVKKLDLEGNCLTDLPSYFADFKEIEELILSHNPISEIPSVVYQLQSLKKLRIHGTEDAIPSVSLKMEIDTIKKLKTLPNLEELEFDYSGVPEMRKFALQLHFPKCKICV